MLKNTILPFSKNTPALLRATAMATSHRQPTNTALASSAALRSLLPAIAATTTSTPIRQVHTTSGSVSTFSSSSNLEDQFLQQQRRELATRASRPVHIHEHTFSAETIANNIDVDSDYLAPFSTPEQELLPTVQINRDSTSLIITRPLSSQPHHPNQSTPTSFTLDNVWLRDNCPCPKCVNTSTRQKLHLTEQVPKDISVSSIQVCQQGLKVTWSRGLQVLTGDEGGEEERLKAQPGHPSFYPWEMLLTR
ncbi:hypothetical protein KI688_006322 [Linnemannia hyalina]|uniref:Gamma-butyrobetaine hydroxylase-like N-terminal domain-containing protein n=1 Tax=Linnemannia hyalina TaxID=64524 RepID=A0A9P8BY67_9FUNG|nr:hypothetical protein KI688_006322 [Linnemannia hyalina]